jgi:hypothetical protein
VVVQGRRDREVGVDERQRVAERQGGDGHVIRVSPGHVDGHHPGGVEDARPRLGRAAGGGRGVARSGRRRRQRPRTAAQVTDEVHLPAGVLGLGLRFAHDLGDCVQPAGHVGAAVRQPQFVDLAGHLVPVVRRAGHDHLGRRAEQDQAVPVARGRLLQDRAGLGPRRVEPGQVVAAAGGHGERAVNHDDPVRSPLG